MKNVLLLLIGVLIGFALTYFYFNKFANTQNTTDSKPFLMNFQPFIKSTTGQQEILGVGEKQHTDIIDSDTATMYVDTFRFNLLKSAKPIDVKGNPIDSLRLISWPLKLGGWIIDAKMLNDFLITQNNQSKVSCDAIAIELGYNSKSQRNTLIFTGLNKYEQNKYKKILLHKYAEQQKDPKTTHTNYILEYVDPCTPNCEN